jgi:hypothetical protein
MSFRSTIVRYACLVPIAWFVAYCQRRRTRYVPSLWRCVWLVSTATRTEASLYTLRHAPDGVQDLDDLAVFLVFVAFCAVAAAGSVRRAAANNAGMILLCTNGPH